MNLLLTRLTGLEERKQSIEFKASFDFTFMGGGCCRNAVRSIVEPSDGSIFEPCRAVGVLACEGFVPELDVPVEIGPVIAEFVVVCDG